MIWVVFSIISVALIVAVVYYRVKATALKRKLDILADKETVEAELELATSDQLIAELQKRPHIQYILLTPKFEATGVCLDIEAHNIPPGVSLDLLRMAHQLASNQQPTESEETEE